MTKEVENLLGKSGVKCLPASQELKRVDVTGDYVNFIRSFIDLKK